MQSDHIYEVITTSTNQKIDKVNDEFIDLHNKLSEEVETPESCYSAFLKLKAVVSQWIDDIKRGNLFADILLQHLYRWLSSPESKLYDPQLYNFVNFLMKKCFSELIEKFKSRDANIIFGAFNKLIIETKRPDFEQAQNYVNFIFESIEKFEMFKYIRFNQSRTWKILLFKDKFNYAGFDEAQTEKRIACEWDLINHLPNKVGKIFKMLIAEYVDSVYEFNKENRFKIKSHDSRDNTIQYKNVSNPIKGKDEEDPYVGNFLSYTNSLQLDAIQEMSEADDIHFMRNKIKTHFTESLLAIIEEIQFAKSNADHDFEDSIKNPQNYSDEDLEEVKATYDDWSFQPHLGSHLIQTKPALEFVNFFCDVISVDETIANTAIILRRNCLKKLKVGEFDENSKFEEPSLELVIPQFTCSHCLISRNLDICKLCSCTGKYKNTHGDIELHKLQNKNLLNQHSDVRVLINLLQNIGKIQNMKMLYRIASAKRLLNAY